jgi:3',5'-cyclic AMP phosphodiesterase CpdA
MMSEAVDRRSFLRLGGAAIGLGALYAVGPKLLSAEARDLSAFLGESNGESVKPFTFVQMSDTHVGFQGPPNPLGTAAFEAAVARVNAMPVQPDLVLFTGDLVHDTEKPAEVQTRIAKFREIASKLKVSKLHFVPGEHDAGLDAGVIFREAFGPTHYSFDHKGVHFVALDNVSQARPEVGSEQIAWLKKDLARFSKTTPIIIFTHRPLFDLKPEWEWFTSDGDDVMNALSAYSNVTVLYGHIHREHEVSSGHVHHLAARSLAFAFPDPVSSAEKKPMPFDKDHPFKNLGIREISERRGGSLKQNEVELAMSEYSEINGRQQLLRAVTL